MAIMGIIQPFIIWFFTKIRQLEIIEQEIMAKSEEEVTVEEKAEEKVEEITQPTEGIQVIEPVE